VLAEVPVELQPDAIYGDIPVLHPLDELVDLVTFRVHALGRVCTRGAGANGVTTTVDRQGRSGPPELETV
jgi:hypothetical protein